MRHLIRAACVASIAALVVLLGGSPASAVLAPNGTINAGVHPTYGYSNMLFSFQSNLDGFVWQGYIPEGGRWGEPNYPSYNSEPQRMWVNGGHVAWMKVNSGPYSCFDGGKDGVSWNVHPGSGYVGTWAITAYLLPDKDGLCGGA